MKYHIPEYKNLITKFDSTTGEYKVESCSPDLRLEIINDLYALPGEMNLDARINEVQKVARVFDKTNAYTQIYPGTRDYNKFFEEEKRKFYSGVLIDDEYYVCGDAYWYLNFIRIPDKVKRDEAFPRIFDTDLWWFSLLEKADLMQKFTLTMKKRQLGFSLKGMAKMIKHLWFERTFQGKVAAWDDQYNQTNWDILTNYRTHLLDKTAYYRPFNPSKADLWVQKDEDGRGLKSRIKTANTKVNPGTIVSGKTDLVMFDEAGIAPNLDDAMNFALPAMKFGNIISGSFHAFGAVGKLTHCKPMRQYFYKPESGNFLALPNVWDNKPHQKVCIFVPENYSYGDFIDEYGNSKAEEAKEYILKEYERIKNVKSYKDAVFYLSQGPIKTTDCFNIRHRNIFPTDKIQQHYDWLENHYRPTLYTLYGDKPGEIKYRQGSDSAIVTDWPVTANSYKEGAVVMIEPPVNDFPPHGLYYASTDPIKPINTDMSESLMCIYIYKAAHEIDDEFAQDKLVAWYTGRHADVYETYEICWKLATLYNAWWAIENDQPNYIEWLIGNKKHQRLMKRSDMPILKDWVPKSTIREEYGWRTGSGQGKIKQALLELVHQYVDEEIGVEFNQETGKSTPVYGASRIMDKMLLKEMLEYEEGANIDRIITFGGVLMAAKSNTNRGLKIKRLNTTEDIELRQQALNNYQGRSRLGRRGIRPKLKF